MSRYTPLTMIIAATWVVCACNRSEPAAPMPEPAAPASPASSTATAKPAVLQEDPGAENGAPVTHAIAVLEPTKGSKTRGTVILSSREGGGLDLKIEVSGLPPGKHAYHVHQFGDCSSEDGKAAGTHFNFAGSSENPGANIDRITGNLGELEADKDGNALATAMIGKASLQGNYSVLGRSVVVHEKGNDPKSPPIGAAGGRVACGVIGIADADAQQKAAVPTKRHTVGG